MAVKTKKRLTYRDGYRDGYFKWPARGVFDTSYYDGYCAGWNFRVLSDSNK